MKTRSRKGADSAANVDNAEDGDNAANADNGQAAQESTQPAEGSQAGVFNMSRPANARPSALRVQPLPFSTGSNASVTSLRNLELARKKRELRAKKKPVWKL